MREGEKLAIISTRSAVALGIAGERRIRESRVNLRESEALSYRRLSREPRPLFAPAANLSQVAQVGMKVKKRASEFLEVRLWNIFNPEIRD